MGDPRFLDIAHLIFLDLVERTIDSAGPAGVVDLLMQSAARTAERLPRTDFASFAEFLDAIEDLRSPLARIEGRAEHLGGGLFGLRRCPFADSMRSYRGLQGELGPRFAAVQELFNRPSESMAKLRVGHGAGVCPFCCAHQPLRSLIAGRITIGGKPLRVFQLACKSATGVRGYADEFIRAAGFTREHVDRVLDEHVCCYAITTTE